MADTGKVRIHGKDYKTVALRVTEFREQYPASDGWSIQTEVVERTDECVVVKAIIFKPDLVPVATGYAEEVRSASQINKTSALENCETSAIGRALAAFGLGGTEYASANEVQNAIHQQQAPRPSKPKPPSPKLSEEDEAEIEKVKEAIENAASIEDTEAIGNRLNKYSQAAQTVLRPLCVKRYRAFQKKMKQPPPETGDKDTLGLSSEPT